MQQHLIEQLLKVAELFYEGFNLESQILHILAGHDVVQHYQLFVDLSEESFVVAEHSTLLPVSTVH